MQIFFNKTAELVDKHFSRNAQYNAKNYLRLPVLTNNGCKMLIREG